MQEILERLNLINLELDSLADTENWMKVVRGALLKERQCLIEEINLWY